MADRNYYVLCDDNCKFESMTKEQIIAAIADATGVTPSGIDDAFITKIKEQNHNAPLKFWIGTQAEYNALTPEQNVFYIFSDNDELAEIEQLARETAENVVAGLGDEYLQKTGGSISGDLNLSSGHSVSLSRPSDTGANEHNSAIFTTANDTAFGPLSAQNTLNNLVFQSWNGLSFTTNCPDQPYSGKTAVGVDCRRGYVYADRVFAGTLSEGGSPLEYKYAAKANLPGKITISDSAPTSGSGSDGDIWLEY